jgi:hypothetical protein
LGRKLNDMSKKGQWAEMTQEISDDVVHAFSAVGRFDEISTAIDERFAGVVDVLALPETTPKDLVSELRGKN